MSIRDVIELGPDDFSDEVSLQTLRCSTCGMGAIALYEESRRGAGERWHHAAWPVSDEVVAELEARIAGCPAPRNPGCNCAAHAALATSYRSYLQGPSFMLIRR